jgi:class 3 adenylate cyclase
MRWLDGYIARMTEIVEAEGGVVLRFVGDGILAAFGVPVPRTSDTECAADARHALSAARAMAAAVAELNADQARQRLPAIGLRIGIHSGHVTAGSVGGGAHLEYALIGDTANVAARLEGLAREVDPMAGGPCRTVISDSTRRLAGEPTGETVQTVGTVALRGRTAPMAAWRVVR